MQYAEMKNSPCIFIHPEMCIRDRGGERSPLVAMVTRMTDQKGFDLVERVLDEMLDFDIRFLLPVSYTHLT